MTFLKISIIGIENDKISTKLLNLVLAFFKCFQIVCDLKNTKLCLISNGFSGINYIPIKLYNHSKKTNPYHMKIFLPCKIHGLDIKDEECTICNLTESHTHFEVNNKDFKTPGIFLNTEHSNFSNRIGIDTILEIDKSIESGCEVTSILNFVDRNIAMCSDSDLILFFVFENESNHTNKLYTIISKFNNKFIIDLNKLEDVAYFKSVIDSIKLFLRL